MPSRSTRRLLLACIPAALIIAAACGGDDEPEPTATPNLAATAEIASQAQRPEWFPDSFPLQANTVVVSEQAEAGGGTVQFRSPIAFSRAIEIFDKNWESHGYTPSDRQVSESGGSYTIESADFTGSVVITPASGESLIDVTLTRK